MSSSQLGGAGGGGRGRERKTQSQSHLRGPRASKESHPVGAVTLFPGRHWPALTPGPEAPLFPPPRGEAPHTVPAQCPHPSPLVSMVPGPPSSSCPFLYEEREQAARGQGGRERQEPPQNKRKSRGEAGPWGWASCRIPSFIKYRKVG